MSSQHVLKRTQCYCVVCILALTLDVCILLYYFPMTSLLQSPDRGKSHGSSSSLFGRLGSLRKIKKPVDDERCQGFVVQYCGHQVVSRQDGLEMVREVVQQQAVPKLSSSSASPAHLMEFDISPSGISLTDPLKKFFGRKQFPSRSITYVLRIR